MKKNNWKYMMIVFLVITILCLSIVLVYKDNIITPQKTMDNKLHYSDYDLRKFDSMLSSVDILSSGIIASNEEYDASELIASDWWCAQAIPIPYNTHLTGFSVRLLRRGMPSEPVMILLAHVMQNLNYPEYFFVGGYVYPEQLPQSDTGYWFGMSFDPVLSTSGMLCLVVLTEDVYDNDFWMWSIATDNPIDEPGMSLHWWDFDNDQWRNTGMENCDGTYRIYAEEGEQDAPSISISSNTTVAIATYTGIISLLCAVVSGTKYRWF